MGQGRRAGGQIPLIQKASTMSRAAVVQFCQRIASNPELQQRMENGVKSGAGWEFFILLGLEHGFEFTAHEAADCFEHERQRRDALESSEHSETTILKQSTVSDPHLIETLILRHGDSESGGGAAHRADGLSLNGFRRVALSHNWHIELPATAAYEDDSIFG